MAEKYDSDVVIAGAGPAGLTLAALLAERGVTSIIIDRVHPRDLAKPTHDTRTTALSFGTVQLLTELGFWDDLAQRAEPILTIDIRDGKAPLLLHFGEDAAADIVQTDQTPMGWIVENPDLRMKLWQAIEARANLCHVMTPYSVTAYQADDTGVTVTLNGDKTVRAKLLIGADGRMSAVRDLAQIDVVALDYQQIATVGLIAHDQPHNGRAVEHFMADGPFAVLPFTDTADGVHRSAVVWTRALNARQRRQVRNRDLSEIKLPPDDLHAAIARRLDARYGAMSILGNWDHYPLSLYHANAMIADRVALVGDAAHAIHPIAGQGLNVGMADIACLIDLLGTAKQTGDDLGHSDVLADYQRERRFKVFTMVAATDGLNRLFGLTSLPLKLIRTLGLGAVQATPLLKRFFVKRAMGL
jgi:2-octaprenyl-6-methoxyphenol hydroxylase